MQGRVFQKSARMCEPVPQTAASWVIAICGSNAQGSCRGQARCQRHVPRARAMAQKPFTSSGTDALVGGAAVRMRMVSRSIYPGAAATWRRRPCEGRALLSQYF